MKTLANFTSLLSILFLCGVFSAESSLLGQTQKQPSKELLAECRRMTNDLRQIADMVFDEPPDPEWYRGTGAEPPWPPQIRYAVFYLAHYLISSRICEAAQRGEFEDPNHILRFNIMFVKLALQNSSKLDEEIRGTLHARARDICNSRGRGHWSDEWYDWVAITRCSKAMVEAHIKEDLPKVFDRIGCGNVRDWDRILEIAIRPSVSEATKYVATTTGKAWPLAAPFVDELATFIVKLWRNKVRERADCK